MSHHCAIPDCPRPAKDGQLMCWPHWRRVPKSLNHAVFDTFGTMQRAHGVDRIEAARDYQQARDAAVAAVVEKETNP